MSLALAELGSVAEFVNGAAFKPEDWGQEGQRIIRIQNLTDPSKPFNRTTREVPSKLHVVPGDLLVSWSASLGVFEWPGPDVALLNQHIFRVLPDEGKVDRRYLRYGLALALEQMKRHLHGATMQHVNRGEFLSTKIYLPPLPEQRRIAEILDKADALRAKRRAALAQLDTLTQSIFLDMFGDPATNPKGWPYHHLGDVADFYAGSTLPEGETFNGQPDGYFLLKVSDMNLVGNEVYLKLSQQWSRTPGAVSSSCPAGSVVIPKRGGAIGTNKKRIAVRPSVLDPNLMAITPRQNFLELSFLYAWFLRLDLASITSGSSVPQLNKRDLDPLCIPVPPFELQREFSRRLGAVEQVVAVYERAAADHDALFASLQHRAFREDLWPGFDEVSEDARDRGR